MVQTYQSPVRVYKYPFELIMAAYEKRFPTCPQIPIFVGCEVVSEELNADGSLHLIQRKCQLNVDAPYILKKIAGVEFVYFMQSNRLDRRKRTLDIDAFNVTFSNRLVVNEKCSYYVHPEQSDWTCFEQSATLDVKSFFGFESSVEKIAVKQYAANIQKGKEIIEHFIGELLDSGVTFIPQFPDPPPASPTDSAIDVAKLEEDVESDGEKMKAEAEREGVVCRSRTGTMIKRRLSDVEGDFKLESDYIQRFLGLLTALEESRLCELKYSLKSMHKGKLPNDAHLLRFLRAREFDVAKAREMVANSILWRKQHNVDKILSTYHPPPVLQQFFPGCWHHHDREGRPIFLLRLGQMDIKGLLRSVGEDGVVKFVLSICEEGLRRTEEATKTKGQPISTWTLLVDLEGLNMRHLWRPGVKALLRIIEIAEAHYPETMGQALVVRAPRVFPVLWTLVGPLIHENTRIKFIILGGQDSLPELQEFIHPDFIPEFLDGSCYSLMSEGGIIPKSLHAPTAAGDGEASHVLESLYHSGYVYKGLPHEVLVPVSSQGCVLTWDFDVVKGSSEFSLLRTPRLIQPESVPAPSPPLGALSPGALVAAVGSQHDVVFDRSLQLGVDLFLEEKPLLCQESDSVQGSHYCSRSGTYILQWRHAEAPHPSHVTFDFTLPSKCKVMYYHELIDSADFKGSMASLESCRSSLSSLSVGRAGETPSSPRKESQV